MRKPRTSALVRAFNTDFGVNPVQPSSWFQSIRLAYGYEMFITSALTFDGTAAWNGTQPAFKNALAGGFRYLGLYIRKPTNANVITAWNNAGIYKNKVAIIAVDVEDSGFQPTAQMFTDLKAAIVADGCKTHVMLYTGKSLYQDAQYANMGSVDTTFSTEDLYEFAGDITYWPGAITEQPYNVFNGWNASSTFRKGWQIKQQTPDTYAGIQVSRNVFTRAYLDGGLT